MYRNYLSYFFREEVAHLQKEKTEWKQFVQTLEKGLTDCKFIAYVRTVELKKQFVSNYISITFIILMFFFFLA